jgi:predicted Zn-dependent protease with MMP-like domain
MSGHGGTPHLSRHASALAPYARLVPRPPWNPAVGPGRAGGRRFRRLNRRDRHGRGLRGPLLPADLPGWRSRADRFDDLVLDVVEHLERRWGRELDGVEFAVEDVPPSDPAPWEHGEVPLGRFFPARGEEPPRVVVYRRPVETRGGDPREIAALVHDVVVEQVAHLLGLSPEQVDPGFGED